MVITNFHTHTKFCDGSGEPEEYAAEALAQHLKILGYSAHAPVPFPCDWTIPPEKFQQYLTIIKYLKNKYSGELEIYSGLEIDFIPDLWPQMKDAIDPAQLDYFLGSIHFIDYFEDGTRWSIDGTTEEFQKGWNEIFYGDSHRIVQKYFSYTRAMIKEMKPPVIGHLDKIKMQYNGQCFIPETDPVYRKELMQTLEDIATAGTVVEINTRGMYRRNEPSFYPGLWVLREMAKMDIPVMVNSDAHHPRELILLFDKAREQLRQAGYKSVSYFSKGEWLQTEI